jgi:bifunctional non-homologous end joining protein LigD
MAKAPRKPRPLRRDVGALVERVASHPIVGRKPDPRQRGLFDAPPTWIAPCLPVLVKTPPSGPEWAHEIKHDGYRAICLVDQGKVRIYTRRGHDWSARMPNIAAALAGLRLRSALIDGEAIMTGEDGVSDFFALHAALAMRSAPHATLMALDILHLDGEDIRQTPLS